MNDKTEINQNAGLGSHGNTFIAEQYNGLSVADATHMAVEGVKKIAVDAARLIRELSQPALDAGMDLRYEYSPESFMGTEMDAAVEICQAVIEAIGATPERKVILNLPTTVENCMPNYWLTL